MEFAFSEAQQHWHDAVVRFATEELIEPEPELRESRGEFCARGLCSLRQVRPARPPGPYRIWRPGSGSFHDHRRDGRPRLWLYGFRPDLRAQRRPLDGHPADRHVRHRCPETAVFAGNSATAGSWEPTAPASPKPVPTSSAWRPEPRPRRFLGPQRAEDLDHRRSDRRPVPLLRHHGPDAAESSAFPRSSSKRHPRISRGPRDPQDGDANGPHGRAGLRGLRAARGQPARDVKDRGRRSSTPAWSSSGVPSSPTPSARCDGSSNVARSMRGRGSSSVSRSASSSRSRIGSLTWPYGWKRAG